MGYILRQLFRLSSDMPSPKITIIDIPERPPPLEFITLTERPATQKSDFSYVVRSHAMQAVIHERRNPKSKKGAATSNLSAETAIKTSKELSGRFKLNTWAKKKRQRKHTQAQEPDENVSTNVRSDVVPFEQVSTFTDITDGRLKFGYSDPSYDRITVLWSPANIHVEHPYTAASLSLYVTPLLFSVSDLKISSQITQASL